MKKIVTWLVILSMVLSVCSSILCVAADVSFEPFKITVTRTGYSGDYKRILIENAFGFNPSANQLAGCVLNGTVTYSGTEDCSKQIVFKNVKVEQQPARTDGKIALDFLVPSGHTIFMGTTEDANYVWDLTISAEPQEVEPDTCTFFVTPDMFEKRLGSFTVTTDGAYDVLYLKNTRAEDAVTAVDAPISGTYSVYSFTRDYSFLLTGTRYMDISIDGTHMQPAGKHGESGFAWEKIGEVTLSADKSMVITVHASSSASYSKTAALMFTTDKNAVPNETDAALNAVFAQNKAIYGKYPLSADATSLYLDYTDFASDMGSWVLGSDGGYLHGLKDETEDIKPATALIKVPQEGTYYVWGCARDYSSNNQGSRFAHISVNGKQLPFKIGQHGATENTGASGSFGWTQAGTVYLTAGEHTIGVEDTSCNYARVKGVFLTTDSVFNGFKQGNVTEALNYPAEVLAGMIELSAFETVDDSVSYTVKNRTEDNLDNLSVITTLYDDQGTMVGNHIESFQNVSASTSLDRANVKLTPTGNWTRGKVMLWNGMQTMRPLEEALSFAFTPNDGASGLVSEFPSYALEQKEPTESVTLENEQTKVVFYKVPTSKGQVVQNEIYSKTDDGEWVKTNTREEPLGHYLLRADSALSTVSEDKMVFETQHTANDNSTVSYKGENPYLAGLGKWLVPIEYTKDGNKVTLVFADTNGASLSAEWCLEEDNAAPLVSATITALDGGYYSLGSFEGKDFSATEYSDAVAPFRVIGKRVHPEICSLNEQFLFTPMGCYTLNENNGYTTSAVTKGVVADPDYIPLRWVYQNNTLFGINMKTAEGTHRGTLFAPNMGSEESQMDANQSYTVKYRVISSVSDWFQNYKFVAQELFDVKDYRQNTYSTLNQAIFNTRKLMMDDTYGGWDNEMMGHYNMEAIHTVSSANPMQALQDYLLSEDEEILEKRAIPTIASFLTRSNLHFNPETKEFGSTTNWVEREKEHDSIGYPNNAYNANVTAGLYEMTGGNVPYLYELGLEKGEQDVYSGYSSIAPFSNTLNLYLYTNEEIYLEQAVEMADAYLENVVYADKTELPAWKEFVYTSYYPNLGSLIDIYEVTKDEKYLDAAEYVAQMMVTALWVPGIDGDKKTEPVKINYIDGMKTGEVQVHPYLYGKQGSYTIFWQGDKTFRIGDHRSASDYHTPLYEKQGTAENWMHSRVGLGLEQASTFDDISSNIIMQSFAGDFMRLSAYTGEDMFANAARNAIVGRFSNYPGYYQSFVYTLPFEADYPYSGPDYSQIYWHHIPAFLAMLEDFLINQTMAWSDNRISFPSLRQQGYAYFNSNQYGHKSGTFFDQTDMWPYLAENTIDSGHLQIDWMAARKDGMLGIALMNESAEDVTTTVSLLDGIPGGKTFTGTATLFDKEGNKSQINVENGKFEITVPAKGLKAVTIAIPEIKAPAFAENSYLTYGDYEIGATASVHKNGKGYVLQVNPENYFAYVYVSDMPEQVKEVQMTYSVGDVTKTVTDNKYPFEFIVKAESAEDEFQYALSATLSDGSNASYGSATLMPKALSDQNNKHYTGVVEGISKTTATVVYNGNGAQFEPKDVVYTRRGRSGTDFRFAVNKPLLSDIGDTAEAFVGLPVAGNVVSNGVTTRVFTVITSAEIKGNEIVLSVAETPEITTKIYGNTSFSAQFNLTVYPYGTQAEAIDYGISASQPEDAYNGSGTVFTPIVFQYDRQGHDKVSSFRFVVPKNSITEITPNEKELVGLTIKGYVLNGEEKYPFKSVITAIEDRSDNIVVVVPQTEAITIAEYADSTKGNYQFFLKIYPYGQ